jgi:hypothetical protein
MTTSVKLNASNGRRFSQPFHQEDAGFPAAFRS